jgi:hypothetical protein
MKKKKKKKVMIHKEQTLLRNPWKRKENLLWKKIIMLRKIVKLK